MPHAEVDQTTALSNSTSLLGAVNGTPIASTLRDVLSVKDHGAKGNNSANDTASIQGTLEAAAEIGSRLSTVDGTTVLPIKQTVFIPDGTYLINGALTIPQGVDLIASPNAIIRASAEMEAMLTSGNSTLLQDQTVDGGIWDCNEKALHGLSLPYFAHLILPRLCVYNAAAHSVILGSPESTNPSYEAIVGELRVWRTKGKAIPAESYGLWLRSTDNQIARAIVVGAATCFRTDGSNSMLSKCHGWGYSEHQPTCVFDDNATGTTYVQPYADTPTEYAFRLRGSGTRLIAPTAYKSTAGADNTATAVQIDGTAPALFIEGLRVAGVTAEHRWAKDVNGDTSAAVILGVQCSNVVSETSPNRIGQTPNRVGLALRNAASGSGDLLQGLFSGETIAWRFKSNGELELQGAGLDISKAGAGLKVKEGSNCKQGVSSAMVAGEATVANTAITATSRLILTRQAGGTNPGAVYEATRTAGTSFVVKSTNAADTGTVAYQIFEPG